MGTDSSESCYLDVLGIPLEPSDRHNHQYDADTATHGVLPSYVEIRSLSNVALRLRTLAQLPSEPSTIRVYVDHFQQSNSEFEAHIKDLFQLERKNEYTFGTSFKATASQWTRDYPGCEEWFQVDSYYFADNDRRVAKQEWYNESQKGKKAILRDSMRKVQSDFFQYTKPWTHMTYRVSIHEDTASQYIGEPNYRFGLSIKVSRYHENR